jgi:hypothetical protein
MPRHPLKTKTDGAATGRLVCGLVFLAALAASAAAQLRQGEIRITVKDKTGHTVAAEGVLASQSLQFRRTFATSEDGRAVLRDLPYGSYQLSVTATSFAEYSALIEVRSSLPVVHTVDLQLPSVTTQVPVTASATLLDPGETGFINHLSSENLRDRPTSLPGHSVIDLVNQQPGWLLEANGVLHPRGAEYDTQYVVDGIPVFENRSPGFAPELDADDVASMNILTSNFPAEFGRKLGGVVEANTRASRADGFHGTLAGHGGSFATGGGFLGGGYQAQHTAATFSISGGSTGRYLDPPVTSNFTNSGSDFGFSTGIDHDLTENDRLQASFRYGQSNFEVPDEMLQQEAGQLQQRSTQEFSGQFSYQHVFSPDLLGSFYGRGRDLSATLDSNDLSTPILPLQDRGFREGYVSGSIAGHHGRHEWKAGADAIFSRVREIFSYRITDASFFDPTTPLSFSFASHSNDMEQAAYVQDLMRLGAFTFSAGLRFDHYHLLVDETAFSPRLGAAYYMDRWGLVLRASYDRIFQTPAVENLLLSSSPAALALNGQSAFLPVRPSRGNYFEVGASKSLFGKASWSTNYYRREIDDFGDDDLLLNTGVSFPIAFQHGSVYGVESKVEVPHWGKASAYVSYSYLIGTAQLPVKGGLFLGDDTSQLQAAGTIPISQDQRNTFSTRLHYQLTKKLWSAAGGSYSSGLPVELNSTDSLDTLISQYGEAVIGKVNFERGRVRPSATIDASVGYDVWTHEHHALRLQADAFNLADRLNVINFAGIFSGTAIAPGRRLAVRAVLSF